MEFLKASCEMKPMSAIITCNYTVTVQCTQTNSSYMYLPQWGMSTHSWPGSGWLLLESGHPPLLECPANEGPVEVEMSFLLVTANVERERCRRVGEGRLCQLWSVWGVSRYVIVWRGRHTNNYEGFLDTVSMNVQYLNIEARFKGPGLLET